MKDKHTFYAILAILVTVLLLAFSGTATKVSAHTIDKKTKIVLPDGKKISLLKMSREYVRMKQQCEGKLLDLPPCPRICRTSGGTKKCWRYEKCY